MAFQRPGTVSHEDNSTQRLKHYADLLVDRPFSSISIDKEPADYLMNCLRFRLNIESSKKSAATPSRFRCGLNNQQTGRPAISIYDTLLSLLKIFDAAGRVEIFRLLIERRSAIPVFLPIEDGSYQYNLSLFHLISKWDPVKGKNISLGEDCELFRVTVITCRKKEQSETAELLKNLFNIESLHREDVRVRCFCSYSVTAEIGFGCIRKSVPDDASAPVEFSQCLVLHVVGDFHPLWSFIKTFTDYLLIEESTGEGDLFHKRQNFPQYVAGIESNTVSEIPYWTVWVPELIENPLEFGEVTLQNFGFSHLRVSGPLSKVNSTILEDIHDAKKEYNNSLNERTKLRKSFGQLFSVELFTGNDFTWVSKMNGNVTGPCGSPEFLELRKSLSLQLSFSKEAEFQEKINENLNDRVKKDQMKELILKEQKLRRSLAPKVKKQPSIQLFLQILSDSESFFRLLATHCFDDEISNQSNACAKIYKKEVEETASEYNRLLPLHGNEHPEVRIAKKKWSEAKKKYISIVVSMEHFWRELGHIFVADRTNNVNLPWLAAQHLMDGLCIELIDGDSNMINLPWIQAIIFELQKYIGKEKRIFVLSILGVQSSGKSTLLNIMFGVRLRTSVGQCTRGLNMQLIKVQDREEYDYILLLDTEGVRAPEYWGLDGSEKRDNQIATLAILLADATIIVNSGENDSAIKEILPIVLMAYQGSMVAEKNGGKLSSMMFFAYNRIDTAQKKKLNDILQLLTASLQETFSIVMGNSQQNNNTGSNEGLVSAGSLFRSFRFDPTDDIKNSDVRIFGNIKKSFLPPDDVPDPAYGEALVEFRNYIHQRVVKSPDGWKSRTLNDLSEYIELVWECICSANFTLNFSSVVERLIYDKLEMDYKSQCENKLGQDYADFFGDQEKKLLIEKFSGNKEHIQLNLYLEDFRIKTCHLDEELDTKFEEITKERGRKRWEVHYEQRWFDFKKDQKIYWENRLKETFESHIKFNDHVEDYKREMRQKIRHFFDDEGGRTLSEDAKTKKFDEIYRGILLDAEKKFPPFSVKERVDLVYLKSQLIKSKGLNLILNSEEEEYIRKKVLFPLIFSVGELSQPSTSSGAIQFVSDFVSSVFSRNPSVPTSKNSDEEITINIHREIKLKLVGKRCYSDSIVDELISLVNDSEKKYNIIDKTKKEKLHKNFKVVITDLLSELQRKWEKLNAVPAKLRQISTENELRKYFDNVSQNLSKIQLFVTTVQNVLAEHIPESFKKETIRLVDFKLRNKSWLNDHKIVQGYIDLHLIELLEKGKVKEVLDQISHPETFYTEVLEDLISEDLPDLELQWTDFKSKLCDSVEWAARQAKNEENSRAKKFLELLRSKCLDNFKDSFLGSKIPSDSDGFEQCDNEEAKVFEEECIKLVKFINEQNNPLLTSRPMSNWKKDLSGDILIFLRDSKREEVARPRCNASCPHCGNLCIHSFGHDVTNRKHDTFHQPQGLNGWQWSEEHHDENLRKTLEFETCGNLEEGITFTIGEYKKVPQADFHKIYPDWVQPRPMERLKFREYVFATYNKEIGEKYDIRMCPNIPPDYFGDLPSIKAEIKARIQQLS